VARTDGDEFVVILGEIGEPKDTAGVGRKILAGLARSLMSGTAN